MFGFLHFLIPYREFNCYSSSFQKLRERQKQIQGQESTVGRRVSELITVEYSRKLKMIIYQMQRSLYLKKSAAFQKFLNHSKSLNYFSVEKIQSNDNEQLHQTLKDEIRLVQSNIKNQLQKLESTEKDLQAHEISVLQLKNGLKDLNSKINRVSTPKSKGNDCQLKLILTKKEVIFLFFHLKVWTIKGISFLLNQITKLENEEERLKKNLSKCEQDCKQFKSKFLNFMKNDSSPQQNAYSSNKEDHLLQTNENLKKGYNFLDTSDND